MTTAKECIQKALKTFEERAVQYGDSYVRHGKVMDALFEPHCLKLLEIEDYNRFGVLNMIVSKLVRYCQDFYEPHIDSIHDMGVYCFILEELDTKLSEPKTLKEYHEGKAK